MKIISHRGKGNIYKANTKEALLEALKKGYIDGIEFDVRMTKDKRIVIIHDPIIDFVSDGKGFVNKLNYKRLLKYNFGSEKYPSKICLLEELLNSINDKIIMIEIKEESRKYKEKADIFYNIIKNYKLNFYITSFNYELLLYLKNKYDLKCGLIIGYLLNTKRIYNHFKFNIVDYSYRKRIDKKESFLFGKLGSEIKEYNIITDKPYLKKYF